MSVKTIFIRTDGTGAYTYEREFKGVIKAIEVKIGDLSTPDVDVADDTYGNSFLSVNGLAADAVYFPGAYLMDDAGADLEVDSGVKAAAPAVCMGVLQVAVTGGGANKKGRVTLLYE